MTKLRLEILYGGFYLTLSYWCQFVYPLKCCGGYPIEYRLGHDFAGGKAGYNPGGNSLANI